jgi:hypothetical protein
MDNTTTDIAIHALVWACIAKAVIGDFKITQRILSAFNKTHLLYETWQIKPWITPLICAPCFSFWACWISALITQPDAGPFLQFGGACFSYLCTKLIHTKI